MPGGETRAEPYDLREGIYVPRRPVAHREDEYDSRGFEVLRRMQRRHFWYRGRHRFLLRAVHRHVRGLAASPAGYRVVDLGGGCGGWLVDLLRRKRFATAEVALADSSMTALRLAADGLPPEVRRYQVDLRDLGWEGRWDLAFLLDVLEHIPEDEDALRQIRDALAPGGLLFVTVPALRRFWTWNDDLAGHQRRYRRADFARLAAACGYRLLDARYFMFFLSPLLLASRLLTGPRVGPMSEERRRQLARSMHEVPHPLANGALALIFGGETPLGHLVRFPWGTSLLAVLKKM